MEIKNIIKTYPNGLRMIVRHMPNFKSVSTNVYIAVGSRHEQEAEHGLAHFVEHMLFKGTTTRSAEDIAGTLDGLGVDVNAYTSNNETCYYTRGLASNVDVCMDILSDMYFNNKFSDEEFKKEAEVIVQEILMRDDDPRQAMFNLARETFFAGTELGHEIAGTVDGIRGYIPADIGSFITKHYVAPKTIISFAGDITVERAEELVAKYFLENFEKHGNDKPSKPRIKTTKDTAILKPKTQFVKKKKDIEQHNVAILIPTINNVHADRYVWSYIYEILVGSMSSRLFMSVREKLGLVYTISGGISLYDLGGYFYIWFSCTPDNTKLVLETTKSEIEKFIRDGASKEELSKVRNTRTAEELYRAENVSATNGKNVTSLSEFNEIKTTEDFLEQINAVTNDDIKRVAMEFLNFNNAIIAAVGQGIDVKALEILKSNN